MLLVRCFIQTLFEWIIITYLSHLLSRNWKLDVATCSPVIWIAIHFKMKLNSYSHRFEFWILNPEPNAIRIQSVFELIVFVSDVPFSLHFCFKCKIHLQCKEVLRILFYTLTFYCCLQPNDAFHIFSMWNRDSVCHWIENRIGGRISTLHYLV